MLLDGAPPPMARNSRRDSTSLGRTAATTVKREGDTSPPATDKVRDQRQRMMEGRRGSNSLGRSGNNNVAKVSQNGTTALVQQQKMDIENANGAEPHSEKRHNGGMDATERHRNEKILSCADSVTRLACRSAFYKQFELGAQIGQGNFSDVFLVYSAEKGEKYAVKEIDKGRMRGKLHFVENEIALLRRCPHRHICRLVDAFECQRQYFLVFDYAQKGDLFETLKRVGRLSERSAAQITLQIASALAFLHRRRIVHRDVKPENILLSADSSVKLSDFGLACIVLGPLYRVCGTPTYVAPEILTQQGYGVEVDIWSLGIILHICLAGFAPFRCTDRVQLFRQIVRGRITFEHPNWSRISFRAKRLLLGMLVADPAGRVNAEQTAKHEWILTPTMTTASSAPVPTVAD